MKIAYSRLDALIEISSDYVTGLVVENALFLYQMLTDFKRAAEGEDSGIIVSEHDTPLAVPKTVALVTDFVGFTLNQKSLLVKVVNELEKTSKDVMHYQKSQEILAEIESFIMDLTLNFPCELICEKLSMQNLLKSVGIMIADDYDSLEERILAYMELTRELEGKQLFVLVNMRCFIPREKLELMLETALIREHKILLIDNTEYPRLRREKRVVIDEDLCVI